MLLPAPFSSLLQAQCQIICESSTFFICNRNEEFESHSVLRVLHKLTFDVTLKSWFEAMLRKDLIALE